MRELSLVSLTVSPFRYFPQEKRLEEFMDIEVELIETGNEKSINFFQIKGQGLLSRYMNPL